MASNRAFPEIDTILSIMHPGYDTLLPVMAELDKQQSELSDSDFSGGVLLREATEGLRSAYDAVIKMKNESEGNAVFNSVEAAVDKAGQALHEIRMALSKQDANTHLAKKLNSINKHLSCVSCSVLSSLQNKLFMMKK